MIIKVRFSFVFNPTKIVKKTRISLQNIKQIKTVIFENTVILKILKMFFSLFCKPTLHIKGKVITFKQKAYP